MKSIIKSFKYGNNEVKIETGVMARQADSAVLVSIGGTSVLVTAVGKKQGDPDRDFFPLTVNYQENGAYPDDTDLTGRTALDWAREQRHRRIVSFLETQE